MTTNNSLSILFLSAEASSLDNTQAEIQQITLSLAKVEDNNIKLEKHISFFLEDYQLKDLYIKTYLDSSLKFVTPLCFTNTSVYERLSRFSKADTVSRLQKMLDKVKILVGFNLLDYHLPLLKRLGLVFTDHSFIDLLKHINYPTHIKNKNFEALCASHNFLPYNSEISKTRTEALNEGLHTLANLYGFDSLLKAATEEKVTLIARVGFDQNWILKDLGFAFNNTTKAWMITANEEGYNKIVATLGTECLEVYNKP
jgi:hypothetical protein